MNRLALACIALLYLVVVAVGVWPDSAGSGGLRSLVSRLHEGVGPAFQGLSGAREAPWKREDDRNSVVANPGTGSVDSSNAGGQRPDSASAVQGLSAGEGLHIGSTMAPGGSGDGGRQTDYLPVASTQGVQMRTPEDYPRNRDNSQIPELVFVGSAPYLRPVLGVMAGGSPSGSNYTLESNSSKEAPDGGVAVADGSSDGGGLPADVRADWQVAERAVVSDRSGRVMEVRLTYYLPTGYPTFTEEWPYEGGVAVDPRVIPLGTKLRIFGDTTVRVANDTGGLVKGAHIDVFFESDAEGRAFIAKYGTKVMIEIVE